MKARVWQEATSHDLRNESHLRSPKGLSHAEVSRKALRPRVPASKEWSASSTAASALPQPALDILGMLPIMVTMQDAAQRAAARPPIGLLELRVGQGG